MAAQRQTYRPLTARQESILRFIVGFISEVGWPPSLREIGANFGIGSLNGVTTHLDAMERKGYISRPSTPRSIKILHPAYCPGNAATMVPLVKGYDHDDLLGEWNVEKMLPVSSKLIGKGRGAFWVRVVGTHLKNDGLLPHDLVVCIPQASYKHLDLVAYGLLGTDSIQVTRLLQNGGEDTYCVPAACLDNIPIIGRVVGLMRDYEGEAF